MAEYLTLSPRPLPVMVAKIKRAYKQVVICFCMMASSFASFRGVDMSTPRT